MEPIFKHIMKVRDYELDAQGIVNNANYQHYYEVTRHEFLETLGISFTGLHNEGTDAIVSSITMKFKSSLRGSDQFYCTVDNLEKKGVRYYFNQKVIRVSDNQICNEARVETVCIVNGKPIYPTIFDEIFAKYIE